MGVVDEHLAAGRGARHRLEPPGHAAQSRQRLERRLGRGPAGHRQGERGQNVGGLEGADQGQLDPVRPPQDVEHQALAFRRGFLGHEAQVAVADPVGQDREAAPRAEGAKLLEGTQVGVQHRRAVRSQKVGEQAPLCGPVGGHVAVIVQMVARQVGEGRRRDPHAVQAILVEAVARGLQDQVADAVLGEARQAAVQLDGVGRGQRPGCAGPRRGQAEGAEARRLQAEMAPDLPGEAGHRGLAVGSGDRRHGLGLAAMEACRHQGQPAPRVVVGDQAHRRHAGLERGPARREHGHGAVAHRLVDVGAAVLACAGQGGEKEPRADLAAVRRETANLGVRQGCRSRHLCRRILDQVSESQPSALLALSG